MAHRETTRAIANETTATMALGLMLPIDPEFLLTSCLPADEHAAPAQAHTVIFLNKLVFNIENGENSISGDES